MNSSCVLCITEKSLPFLRSTYFAMNVCYVNKWDFRFKWKKVLGLDQFDVIVLSKDLCFAKVSFPLFSSCNTYKDCQTSFLGQTIFSTLKAIQFSFFVGIDWKNSFVSSFIESFYSFLWLTPFWKIFSDLLHYKWNSCFCGLDRF